MSELTFNQIRYVCRSVLSGTDMYLFAITWNSWWHWIKRLVLAELAGESFLANAVESHVGYELALTIVLAQTDTVGG